MLSESVTSSTSVLGRCMGREFDQGLHGDRMMVTVMVMVRVEGDGDGDKEALSFCQYRERRGRSEGRGEAVGLLC